MTPLFLREPELRDVDGDPTDGVNFAGIVTQGESGAEVRVGAVVLGNDVLVLLHGPRLGDPSIVGPDRIGQWPGHEIVILLPDDLALRPPEPPSPLAADEDVTAVGVLRRNPHRRVVEDRLQQRLALAERRFGSLLPGDVRRDGSQGALAGLQLGDTPTEKSVLGLHRIDRWVARHAFS